MSRNDNAVEALTPFLFLVIGVAMVTTAAVGGLSGSVAVTFATLGTSLIVLGGVVRIIEGAIEIGPRGLKAQVRRRQAEVVSVLSSAAPEAAGTVDQLIDWVTGADAPQPARARAAESPHVQGPYIKGPALILPRVDGRQTEIDISALKRAATGDQADEHDDALGGGEPLRYGE